MSEQEIQKITIDHSAVVFSDICTLETTGIDTFLATIYDYLDVSQLPKPLTYDVVRDVWQARNES